MLGVIYRKMLCVERSKKVCEVETTFMKLNLYNSPSSLDVCGNEGCKKSIIKKYNSCFFLIQTCLVFAATV